MSRSNRINAKPRTATTQEERDFFQPPFDPRIPRPGTRIQRVFFYGDARIQEFIRKQPDYTLSELVRRLTEARLNTAGCYDTLKDRFLRYAIRTVEPHITVPWDDTLDSARPHYSGYSCYANVSSPNRASMTNKSRSSQNISVGGPSTSGPPQQQNENNNDNPPLTEVTTAFASTLGINQPSSGADLGSAQQFHAPGPENTSLGHSVPNPDTSIPTATTTDAINAILNGPPGSTLDPNATQFRQRSVLYKRSPANFSARDILPSGTPQTPYNPGRSLYMPAGYYPNANPMHPSQYSQNMYWEQGLHFDSHWTPAAPHQLSMNPITSTHLLSRLTVQSSTQRATPALTVGDPPATVILNHEIPNNIPPLNPAADTQAQEDGGPSDETINESPASSHRESSIHESEHRADPAENPHSRHSQHSRISNSSIQLLEEIRNRYIQDVQILEARREKLYADEQIIIRRQQEALCHQEFLFSVMGNPALVGHNTGPLPTSGFSIKNTKTNGELGAIPAQSSPKNNKASTSGQSTKETQSNVTVPSRKIKKSHHKSPKHQSSQYKRDTSNSSTASWTSDESYSTKASSSHSSSTKRRTSRARMTTGDTNRLIKYFNTVKITFSGEETKAKGFLDDVKEAVRQHGVNFDDAIPVVKHTLSGDALFWFEAEQGTHSIDTWKRFERAFKLRFVGRFRDEDILTELKKRTQGVKPHIEPIHAFVSSCKLIVGHLHNPPSERRLVRMARSNLAPEYQEYMRNQRIERFSTLLRLGKKFENEKVKLAGITPPPTREQSLIKAAAFVPKTDTKSKVAAITTNEVNKPVNSKPQNQRPPPNVQQTQTAAPGIDLQKWPWTPETIQKMRELLGGQLIPLVQPQSTPQTI